MCKKCNKILGRSSKNGTVPTMSYDPVPFLILLIIVLPISEEIGHEAKIPLNFFAEFCTFREGNTSSSCQSAKWSSMLLRHFPDFHLSLKLSSFPNGLINANIELTNKSHNGLVVIFRPKNEGDFQTVLQRISYELTHNENVRPWKIMRVAHIICLPQLSGQTSRTDEAESIAEYFGLAAKRINIPLNEEVYIVAPALAHELGDMKIFELYSINGSVVVEDVSESAADNTENGSMNLEELLRIAERRGNLRGTRLKVLAQPDRGYEEVILLTEDSNGKVQFTGGAFLPMLYDFQYLLNFTYESVAGKGWIDHVIENGTKLSGLGRQIMDGEADFSISSNVMKPERTSRIGFLPSVQYQDAAVIFRDPSTLASRHDVLRPFSSTLWIFALLTWIALPICAVIAILIWYRFQGFSKYCLHLGDLYSWNMSAISCQGWYLDPKISSFRLFLLVGAVTGFLLYASYGASFAAFLSVPSRVIHKFQDFYTHGYIVYTHPVYTHHTDAFVQTKEEKQRILETSERIFTSLQDSFVHIANLHSRHALILNIHGLYLHGTLANITEDALCQLSVLTEGHGRSKEAMILRRGSPLRELFNHRTSLLIERGFVDRCNDDFNRRTLLSCSILDEANRRSVTPIEIGACVYQFEIVTAGAALSILIVAIEIISKKYRE